MWKLSCYNWKINIAGSFAVQFLGDLYYFHYCGSCHELPCWYFFLLSGLPNEFIFRGTLLKYFPFKLMNAANCMFPLRASDLNYKLTQGGSESRNLDYPGLGSRHTRVSQCSCLLLPALRAGRWGLGGVLALLPMLYSRTGLGHL